MNRVGFDNFVAKEKTPLSCKRTLNHLDILYAYLMCDMCIMVFRDYLEFPHNTRHNQRIEQALAEEQDVAKAKQFQSLWLL